MLKDFHLTLLSTYLNLGGPLFSDFPDMVENDKDVTEK